MPPDRIARETRLNAGLDALDGSVKCSTRRRVIEAAEYVVETRTAGDGRTSFAYFHAIGGCQSDANPGLVIAFPSPASRTRPPDLSAPIPTVGPVDPAHAATLSDGDLWRLARAVDERYRDIGEEAGQVDEWRKSIKRELRRRRGKD